MDYRDIEQLLERYWQCETSLAEEETLRRFFAEEEVPAHLLRYKPLFAYLWSQREPAPGEDFDARLLAAVETPAVKARPLTPLSRFVPLFKAVAAVAVVLLLGNVAQHSFTEDDGSVLATDTIGRQVTAPSVAISNDAKAEQVFPDTLPPRAGTAEAVDE